MRDDSRTRRIGIGFRQRTESILQNNSERKTFLLI